MFRELEAKFKKPHPLLEQFKEPSPVYAWLPAAFFALHRRRQFRDEGRYQPLTYQEMATYATQVIRLDPSVTSLFYRVMEETDNAVLYDQIVKANDAYQAAKAEQERRGGRKPPR
jgi:hypothetical protein